MSPDQVISLFSSIGACLAAVAAFLTVRQIAKQRKDAYRPDLAFPRTTVHVYADNYGAKKGVPNIWLHEERNDREIQSSEFHFKIYNVGFGVAKDISIAWESPIETWIADVNARAQRVLAPAFYKYEGGALSFESDIFSRHTSMWSNEKSDSLDYVLPSDINKEGNSLHFPFTFRSLLSAYFFFTFEAKYALDVSSHPAISLHLEYQDIGGSKHQATFDVIFHLVAYTNGETASHFFGYIDIKKK